MDQLSDIGQKLGELGYRLTLQRRMILKAIEETDGHISAEEIYRSISARFPHMNISTVYRTMELLKGLGLVTETNLGDGRLRYHCIGKGHHHHLICEKCGKTIDVEESLMNPLWARIRERYGFTVNMRHIAFFGVCPECRTKSGIDNT